MGAMPLNNPGGVRMSTAITYLDECRHRLNLTIRADVLARRIVFERGSAGPPRAVSVEVESGGEVFVIEGDAIILSAGAIASPQLLMLSGVGPAAELRPLGIGVIHDLPGVGRGMKNHPSVSIVYRSQPGHRLASGRAAQPGGAAVHRRRLADAQRRAGAAHHVLPRKPGRAQHPHRLPSGIPLQRGITDPGLRRRVSAAASGLPVSHRPAGYRPVPRRRAPHRGHL